MAERGGPGGGTWGRVAFVVIVLLIAAMVVSLILNVVKLVIYAALLLFGVAIVLRAVRGRR